ncbi:MAG: phosphate acetyltransferase [Bacteroidetes bacterium MedPE-SWsnd-G2]|nr:MAG: phosphate acetyltransferase [Bacteroidetes bacterium MedPE-SWsnd-G2]
MNKAIYIASNDANSGKSILSIGLINSLLSQKPKVGYFRPVIDDPIDGGKDNHINTILSHFKLKMAYEDTYAFTMSQLIKKLNNHEQDDVINTVIAKYKKLEEENDFVIVEGTDFSEYGPLIELDLNILIAKNLGIPVIIIASCIDKPVESFVDGVHLIYDSFVQKDVNVISVVANKVKTEMVDMISTKLNSTIGEEVSINIIPLNHKLKNPTIKEMADAIDAKILFGQDLLNRPTGNIEIGAMRISNYLDYISEDCVVITPSDREDVLMATLQANISVNYPNISGVVLTGGRNLSDSVVNLINGLDKIVPILLVEEATFSAAKKLAAVRSHIYASNKDKIKLSIEMFEKYVDADNLNLQLSTTKKVEAMTPRMFQYNLLKRARTERKHIVLPEGMDDRILIAATQLQKIDVVDLTILGSPMRVEASVKRLNIPFDFEKTPIIDPSNSEHFKSFSETLHELRAHKGLSLAMAQDLMADVSYFGTMMVYKGLADGMVSGAAHTTQHTIKPALQFVKTKPSFSVVSSIFFMCLEDRVSVFGDCAINPNPTAEQLAEIAISSADSSIQFGINPKIAMLSYSSGVSGKGEDVETVRMATEIVKEKRPDLKVEGPIQYDAAVDPSVGKQKLPDSEVAGQANVLIFPDLNTGNNTYKAVQRETGALAIGPMLQGLNKPVNDLSRGCTVDDIFNTVVLTAIQAQDN